MTARAFSAGAGPGPLLVQLETPPGHDRGGTEDQRYQRHHRQRRGRLDRRLNLSESRRGERYPRGKVGQHRHLRDNQNGYCERDSRQQTATQRRRPAGRDGNERGQHAEGAQSREATEGLGAGQAQTDGKTRDRQQQYGGRRVPERCRQRIPARKAN